MAKFPRGIAPDLLVSQVRNTMPYLFGQDPSPIAETPPAAAVRAFAPTSPEPLSHFDYFRLCVSSHYLTCATPVPTDVDNQIRHKLWPPGLPLATALEMAGFVLDTRAWPFTLLTSRSGCGAPGTPWESEPLHGHLGEWFTIASAAYCALGRYPEPEAATLRQELFDAIAAETDRHSEIFGSLWRAEDGIAALKAAASIAHNFGDLDRVMDMWELPFADPLRLGYYKLTHSPFDADRKLRHKGRLWTAGELYKSEIDGSAMALENHRHFALRKPRCLRRSPELRVPTGPFFDDWGARVAELTEGEDTAEAVEALAHGWERLPRTVGYGRALRAIFEARPELRESSRMAAITSHPRFRQILETPRELFEARWDKEARALLDDIPSRA